MQAEEKKIEIIANESNTVFEVEAGGAAAHTSEPATIAGKLEVSEQRDADIEHPAAERTTNEVATNDGAVVETLDTAFHNKPGVAEGENFSGSSRADYYEARSQGKSDVEEELDQLQKGQA
jgi:hypothetical protein